MTSFHSIEDSVQDELQDQTDAGSNFDRVSSGGMNPHKDGHRNVAGKATSSPETTPAQPPKIVDQMTNAVLYTRAQKYLEDLQGVLRKCRKMII